MSDAHVDDLLRDLATELSIEPSPQMVARVRARVYAGSRFLSRLASWNVGIAVTVLMIAIALGIAPDRQAVQKQVAQAPARQVEASRRMAERPALSAIPQSAPDRAQASIARRPADVRPAPAAADPSAAEPVAEVLVPPDQAVALRRILLAMRRGHSPVPPASVEAVDAAGRLPVPEGIEIPPITIQPLTPLPDGGRSKDR
jgi:hypothetical protein